MAKPKGSQVCDVFRSKGVKTTVESLSRRPVRRANQKRRCDREKNRKPLSAYKYFECCWLSRFCGSQILVVCADELPRNRVTGESNNASKDATT